MWQCPWCKRKYNPGLKRWERGPGYFEPEKKYKTCPKCLEKHPTRKRERAGFVI